MSVGQRLVMSLSGSSLTTAEAAFLAKNVPAGVILFSRNVEAPDQVVELVKEIRSACDPSPTIWIDQEGGRVQRLRDPFCRHPSPGRFAATEAWNPEGALELSELGGRLCGLELASLGIGVDCAPVLDIQEAGADPVIGERAFGEHPEQVVRLAGAWMRGLAGSGVMAVGKHFPGHGAAKADSHKELPTVDKSFDDLDGWELWPFSTLLDRLPAVMTAHLVATGLDRENPATCSRATLKVLLREKWGYGGLVVSDALEMGALSGSMAERAAQAVTAGCDLLLCCTGDLADNEAALAGIATAREAMPDPAWTRVRERIEKRLAPYRLAPKTWRDLLNDDDYRRDRARLEGLGEKSLAADPTEAPGAT